MDIQVLVGDVEFKAIKRAVWAHDRALQRGKLQCVGIGVSCDCCGQEGLLYYHDGEPKILLCDRLAMAIQEEFYRRESAAWDAASKSSFAYVPQYTVPTNSIGGAKYHSIDCGEDLLRYLRQRHCWFPTNS